MSVEDTDFEMEFFIALAGELRSVLQVSNINYGVHFEGAFQCGDGLEWRMGVCLGGVRVGTVFGYGVVQYHSCGDIESFLLDDPGSFSVEGVALAVLKWHDWGCAFSRTRGGSILGDL